MKRFFVVCFLTMAVCGAARGDGSMDAKFEAMAARYIDEFPALSPVSATSLGDHRFDAELDEVDAAARARSSAFVRKYLAEAEAIDPAQLSRALQVDHAALGQRLRGQLWRQEVLREWEWNPLNYTGLVGGAVYGLMAREFAPLDTRLSCVASRLEAFPRLFEEIRETLVPELVPKIHAETAIKQNRGVLSILKNMVEPHLEALPGAERARLEAAMETGRAAVETHQTWLEEALLPKAAGEFRLGKERYDIKLGYTLKTSFTRKQVRKRAEAEMKRVRAEMYEVAKGVYHKANPYTEFPERPDAAYRQAVTRAALELAYAEMPARDGVVAAAKESLVLTKAFIIEHDLVTVPEDPVEIIVMPEFQRGVALAYCDSPGPLDVGLKTYYAVAPPPADWDETQVRSFLREYNVRSIHDLTIHEAMPGHFLQLAMSNRYPGTLRAVLSSGVFIEGWAVYAEQMMSEEGFLDGDPLMRLIALKWYLRGVGNAIIDQAIHVEGMTRGEAMRLMIEDTFQEEREAAAKWTRAQLTSTQLATYFVGYQEHRDLRAEAEERWGEEFSLKRYHDAVLSHGSPPVQFARALLFDLDVPRK